MKTNLFITSLVASVFSFSVVLSEAKDLREAMLPQEIRSPEDRPPAPSVNLILTARIAPALTHREFAQNYGIEWRVRWLTKPTK